MKKFLCILLIYSKIVQLNCTGKGKRKLDEYLEEKPSNSNEFSHNSKTKSKQFDLNELPDDDEFDLFNEENNQHSSSAPQNPMHNIHQIIVESSSNPTINDHNNPSHIEPTMIVNSSLVSIERDDIDHRRKSWAFLANIGKNNIPEKLFTEFGLTINKRNTNTLNLRCQKQNPTGGFCPFVGIYFKSNGNLYTKGKHEHSEKGKTPQNVGDDYVDKYSNVWSFQEEIGKDSPNEKLRNSGFSIISNNHSRLYLICQKVGTNGGKCPFKGIYLESNGCLYTQGQHEHKHN